MLSSRLTLALDDGLLRLPEAGRIAVLSPSADADLSALPKERVQVISRWFPVHEAFLQAGYDVAIAPSGRYATSVLCLPRAKAESRASVAAALSVTDGPLWIDGQKTDGVESLLKDLRKRGDVGDVVVKAHGKLFSVEDADVADWVGQPGSITSETGEAFQTAPGVFSADGVDPGSFALAEILPRDLKGHVIDLGAGWGYLGAAILRSEKVTRLDLVEADHTALEAARANISDPRAEFHWADAQNIRCDRADHVVTNPPFHTGRAAEPSLGQNFILAAARLLKPKGRLWLVANRHLPYERTLESAFREVRTLSETQGYKITEARAPRALSKG